MVLTSLLLPLVTGPAIVCAVSGDPIDADSKHFDVNGVRFGVCKPECEAEFRKEPLAWPAKGVKEGRIVGVGVFDPVSGKRLTPQTARGGTSDFAGVRFAFSSAANKAVFDADPKRYGTVPEKSAENCPIMGVKLGPLFLAPAFRDIGGVRYFACCEQCMPKLLSEKFAANGSDAKPPKIDAVPKPWLKLSGPGLD